MTATRKEEEGEDDQLENEAEVQVEKTRTRLKPGAKKATNVAAMRRKGSTPGSAERGMEDEDLKAAIAASLKDAARVARR